MISPFDFRGKHPFLNPGVLITFHSFSGIIRSLGYEYSTPGHYRDRGITGNRPVFLQKIHLLEKLQR